MSHEERLLTADQLLRKILERYADAVLAVFVTSSTAKGLDQRYSDLELTVVVGDGVELEATSYVYGGILIEIEYPQESAILKTARCVTAHWPVQADTYRNRLLLFERQNWTRRLDEAIAVQDAAEFSKAWHLATTKVIEWRDKLRNAQQAGDELNLRFFGVHLAESAASLVLFLNRRYMTTTRWLFKQTFECPQQPAGFRRQAETLLGLQPAASAQYAEVAEELCVGLLTLAGSLGISVESNELIA